MFVGDHRFRSVCFMATSRRADLSNKDDEAIALKLWIEYAEDPNAGGEVPSEVKETLMDELRARGIDVFLGFYEDKPAGVSIVMKGFSTFNCKTLWNIHDFGVMNLYRRKGIGQAMMNAIFECAKAEGIPKITLEVLEKNKPAWDCYIKAGFKPYVLNPELGWAVEMQKYVQ